MLREKGERTESERRGLGDRLGLGLGHIPLIC